MKPVGVFCFPGTQCDQDIMKALKLVHVPARWIWHTDRFDYKTYSGFVLPGGFSYGDYLRAGALAALSTALQDLQAAISSGWPALGICNGFQILCETGLLDGTLQFNQNLRFIDSQADLILCHPSVWGGKNQQNIKLPIAHKTGRFYVSEDQLKRLQDEERIWWQYQNNPNGSVWDIAGVINHTGRVAGLMPHPERAMAEWMGGTDGLSFFQIIL